MTPDIASKQLDAEASPAVPTLTQPTLSSVHESTHLPDVYEPTPAPPTARFTRFHGSVHVDSARVGRDAGRIADEVIAHLAGQVGAEVRVTIEIEARLPNGTSDQLVRTVTENCRTLKFDSQGFEKE